MKFQITQNFGHGILGFIYFEAAENSTIEDLKIKALEAQRIDYKKRYSGWSGKSTELPTIKVKEYDSVKNRVVYKGLKFKVKWR